MTPPGPRWDVAYTLDGCLEIYPLRAACAAEAAWKVALDLADRGFGDRVLFVSVEAVRT